MKKIIRYTGNRISSRIARPRIINKKTARKVQLHNAQIEPLATLHSATTRLGLRRVWVLFGHLALVSHLLLPRLQGIGKNGLHTPGNETGKTSQEKSFILVFIQTIASSSILA